MGKRTTVGTSSAEAMQRRLDPAAAPPLGYVVNVQPQTRKERQAQSFREDLEKMRLRQRRENYCHYEEGGIVQPAESLGYISEADRFVTDIAGVNKTEREAEVAKREQMYH